MALGVERISVRIAYQACLVTHPDDAPVRSQVAVVRLQRLPGFANVRRLGQDALTVVGMNDAGQKSGVRLPLLGQVSEQPLDLRADVDFRDLQVERPDVCDEGQLLDEIPVSLFGRPQLFLRLDALGHVAVRAAEALEVSRRTDIGNSVAFEVAVRAILVNPTDDETRPVCFSMHSRKIARTSSWSSAWISSKESWPRSSTAR